VNITAKVFLGKDDTGFKVNRIDLEAKAAVEGLDQSAFAAIAEKVKATCPISRALSATDITLKAELQT
jgi:osmotically inducible protein OsmC